MKKLKLRREAIRVLGHLELGNVQGGQLPTAVLICSGGFNCLSERTLCKPLTDAC